MTTGVASAHIRSDVQKERLHIKHRGLKEKGVPYLYGGETPDGFDCSGFTRWTFLKHGEDLPHSAALQFNLGKQGDYKRVWKRKHLKKGDLVFFDTTSARVGHTGIYTGHGKFVSATTSSGVHVDSVRDPYYWGSRWIGATRVPATRQNYSATQETEGSLQAESIQMRAPLL
jgi:cell wall-associated NlpC family hydrolase